MKDTLTLRLVLPLVFPMLLPALLPAESVQPEGAGPPFPALCASLAREAEAADRVTVKGSDGWIFLASELRHLGVGPFWGERAVAVSRATRPEAADPLPTIVDVHKQLAAIGCELLVVPVPPKSMVYADRLPGASFTPDTAAAQSVHGSFYHLLAAHEVRVLDLREAFHAARAIDAEDGPVYCKTDTHWSGRACVIAAQRIAALIKDRPWVAEVKRATFATETRMTGIRGDLPAAEGEGSGVTEQLPLRFVGTGSGSELTPVEDDVRSPVLLLGDSHCLVFHAGDDMHARGAGLADQLAAELGIPIDTLGVRGSGATPARINLYRRAKRDPAYWNGKKLVVWCFAARELTEADGWQVIPVKPAARR